MLESSPKEKEFFNKLFITRSNSFLLLEKTINRLNEYKYSTETFFAILLTNIAEKTNTKSADCEAISFNIYVQQLNW